MELIRDVIEWIGTQTVSTAATLFPLAAIGLLGLYVLWLVVGYLRVSQVGLGDRPEGRVVALPAPAEDEAPADHPRGVPYCAADALQYPLGARFCAKCERDLLLDCTNCGATLSAGDASCYRCGTRTGADAKLPA